MRHSNMIRSILAGSHGVFMGPNQGARAAAQPVATQPAAQPVVMTADQLAELERLRARNAELEAEAKKPKTKLDNVEYTIDADQILTLRVDLKKIQPTAGQIGSSGDELVTDRIAASGGQFRIPVTGREHGGYFSLNVGAWPNGPKASSRRGRR